MQSCISAFPDSNEIVMQKSVIYMKLSHSYNIVAYLTHNLINREYLWIGCDPDQQVYMGFPVSLQNHT